MITSQEVMPALGREAHKEHSDLPKVPNPRAKAAPECLQSVQISSAQGGDEAGREQGKVGLLTAGQEPEPPLSGGLECCRVLLLAALAAGRDLGNGNSKGTGKVLEGGTGKQGL